MLDERRRDIDDRQHRENEGLQDADEETEQYPDVRDDSGAQLIQDNQKNFAGKDITKQTKCQGYGFRDFFDEVQR